MTTTTTTTTTADVAIAIGKQDDFLYLAPTFDGVVQYVNLYTSGPWRGAPGPTRLTADDLDFYSGTGSVLTLVRDAADNPRELRPASPPVTQPDELRARIAALYAAATAALTARQAAGLEPRSLRAPVLPPDDAAFDTFVTAVLDDPHNEFDHQLNCTFWPRIFGRC